MSAKAMLNRENVPVANALEKYYQQHKQPVKITESNTKDCIKRKDVLRSWNVSRWRNNPHSAYVSEKEEKR